MAELIQQYQLHIDDANGVTYSISAHGESRSDGTWAGWLEFHPTDNTHSTLRTDRETSQPNRGALEYWASGLEPVYFEGAFARARRKLSTVEATGSKH